MEQKPITYKEVKDLGFKRIESSDTVFYNQYGYEYFIVEMKLAKRISALWDITTRTVNIIRVDNDHTIVGTIHVKDFDELKMYVEFFTKTNYPKGSIMNPNDTVSSTGPVTRYA